MYNSWSLCLSESETQEIEAFLGLVTSRVAGQGEGELCLVAAVGGEGELCLVAAVGGESETAVQADVTGSNARGAFTRETWDLIGIMDRTLWEW